MKFVIDQHLCYAFEVIEIAMLQSTLKKKKQLSKKIYLECKAFQFYMPEAKFHYILVINKFLK